MTNTTMVATSNIPGAGRTIDMIRNCGHTRATAVLDIVDNSVDANASIIHIFLDYDQLNKPSSITVVDNGNGMDWRTLNEAPRIGSKTSHGAGDLGRFGVGLVSAGFSLGDSIEIVTKAVDGYILYCHQNANEIIEKDEFIKYITPSDTTQDCSNGLPIYRRYLGHGGHGTIVRFSQINNHQSTKKFVADLKEKIGQTYRYLITPSRLQIYIHDHNEVDIIEVKAVDPLMWNDSRITQYYEDLHECPYTDSNGDDQISNVEIKISLLPESTNENKDFDINLEKQGLYFLRNDREIVAAQKLDGIFNNHPENNRIRVEIKFRSELDPLMGIEFTKRGITLSRIMFDLLRTIIEPRVRSLQKQIRPRNANQAGDSQADHDLAANLIKRLSHLLLRPILAVEKRIHKKIKDDNETKEPRVINDVERKPRNAKNTNRKEASVNPSIRAEALGADADLFTSYFIGSELNLVWNSDHVFYCKAIKNSKSETKAYFDLFLYMMAMTEKWYDASDDENNLIANELTRRKMLHNIRYSVSHNLRVILDRST